MGDGGSDPFEAEGTIGIEEEFFLVDEDGRPLGGTDELCYAHDPPEILTDRLDHELFTFVIETQTPVIADLASAPATLSAVRDALVGYAADHGYRVAAAGLHPTANWRDLEHVSKPRYRRQLDRIQYPQHRNTTAGLHVHVGVGDGDRAVWVADEIRWYLPLILALSANSPYWCGFDTGLASARACVFESLPNTGMPAAYGTLDRYADLEAAMLETGSISDRGEIWYDVRPHTAYGTVEVRTPDAQRDEWRVLALVEYVHRLVETLAEAHRRLADGADREVVLADAHAPWADPTRATRPAADRLEVLVENKWRAMRHGRDADVIARAATDAIDVETAARAEVDRLGLDRLPALLDARGGAERLRAARADGGAPRVREAIILEAP